MDGLKGREGTCILPKCQRHMMDDCKTEQKLSNMRHNICTEGSIA